MSVVRDHFASLCSPDVGTSRASRLLFGAGFRPQSASQAIDLPSDGGAILNACLHAEARKSVAESGDRALDLGHRSVILWDAIEAFETARPRPKAPPLRSSSRSSSAVVRHGICRQVQQPSSGSTPHDRVTILRICSSSSLPLDWPRQSMSKYPPVIAIQLMRCDASRRSFVSRFALRQLTGSARSQSHTLPSAFKSP